jgi:hypothetical protein
MEVSVGRTPPDFRKSKEKLVSGSDLKAESADEVFSSITVSVLLLIVSVARLAIGVPLIDVPDDVSVVVFKMSPRAGNVAKATTAAAESAAAAAREWRR